MEFFTKVRNGFLEFFDNNIIIDTSVYDIDTVTEMVLNLIEGEQENV